MLTKEKSITAKMQTQSNSVTALEHSKPGCIRGQLHPIEGSKVNRYKTNIGLYTSDGREFVVLMVHQWMPLLTRHMWESVTLKGEINYFENTIELHSFFPTHIKFHTYESDFNESSECFETHRLMNLIKRGFSIPQAA